MKKIFNLLFSFMKYVLLLISFGFTLFLVLKLYARLEKNIKDSISIFVPYILLLILFLINICLNRAYVRKNLFYNITCCFVFTTNIFVAYRAMFDTNMIFNSIQKMGINFNYFNDYLSFNNTMLYGLSIANIVFMIIPNSYNHNDVIAVVEENTYKKEKEDNKVATTLDEVKIDEKSNDSILNNIDIYENDDKNIISDNASIKDDSNLDINNNVEPLKDNKENPSVNEEDIVIKKIDIDDEII